LKTIFPFRRECLGIVLSDASAQQELVDQGGKDVDGVFLTHPFAGF
jgi:hypothetical protein